MLVDQEDRIVAVLVGRPTDAPGRDAWAQTTQEVYELLPQLEEQLKWGGKQTLPSPPGSSGENRRGNYRTVSIGPSYGGGQTASTPILPFLFLPHVRCTSGAAKLFPLQAQRGGFEEL